MNIVIGMIIVLCLMVSEIGTGIVVDDPLQRFLAVFFAACAVPAIAYVQVLHLQIKKKKMRAVGTPMTFGEQQKCVRKIAANHAGIWATAGLFIVGVVQWQDVVRANWQLDRWPVLDEVVILAPIVFALVVSWAVFYEIQRSIPGGKSDKRFERLRYVVLHVRVYVAMVLIPLGIMILVKDLSGSFEAMSGPSVAAATTLSIVCLLALFPFAMLFVWRNRKLEESETRTEIFDICKKNRMNVFDIRIWNTGNQVVNAVVAGSIPRLRILMISDGLLSMFPRNEVAAIVRHEAGHVRLGHLQTRILFVLLPIFAMLGASLFTGAVPSTDWATANVTSIQFDWQTVSSILGIAAYFGYVILIVGWLSKKMEFEADLFAIGAFDSSVSEMSAIEPAKNPVNLAQSMVDALLRFAQENPDQYEKHSLTHPSIRQRIDMIARAAANRESAIEFRRQFLRDQISLGAALLGSLVMILIMVSGE